MSDAPRRRGPARKPIDLTGRVIGRLAVIERVGSPWDFSGRACGRWLCRCECGATRVIRGDALTGTSPTRSCGCLQKERAKQALVEWRESGGEHADMGARPEGHTLDRINPAGNYEPSNCRWATPYDQWLNRRLAAGLHASG